MSNIGKEGRNETSAHFAGDVLQSFSVYGSFCWYPDTTSLLRRPHEISSVQVVHLFVRFHRGERPVGSRPNHHDGNLQSVKRFCSKSRQPCREALTRFVRSRVTRTYAAVSPMDWNRNLLSVSASWAIPADISDGSSGAHCAWGITHVQFSGGEREAASLQQSMRSLYLLHS